MGTHSRLSPSVLPRRELCPGSDVLEFNEPDRESVDSLKGTHGHALRAYCLEKNVEPRDFATLEIDGEIIYIPEETRDLVQKSVDAARKRIGSGILLIEKSFDLSWLFGEEGKGSADEVYIDTDIFEITDYKNGAHRVQAKGNLQLAAYLLGALKDYGYLGEPDQYGMRVDQPRINNIDYVVFDKTGLQKLEDRIRKTADRVREARKANDLTKYLNAGEEQCRFCKGKTNCSAFIAEVAKVTGADFENLNQGDLPDPGVVASLSQQMSKVALVEMWCKAVRAKVEAELLSGILVESYKLVEGKRGNRQWVDDDEAEKMLKSMRLNTEQMYDLSVKSPTKIEKVVAENHPMKWERLQTIITQKQGKPSVAHVSDPRPALEMKPIDDFEELDQPKQGAVK